LAKNNGGVLQYNEWLKNNGHFNLARSIESNPEAYAHIQQAKKWTQKTLEEWRQTAKDLESKYRKLPMGAWLRKNGLYGLVSCMRKNPKEFSDIKQEKGRLTKEIHLKTLKEIIKKNKGKIPTYAWLIKNGQKGLVSWLERNPKIVSNYKREKATITTISHVKNAEILAKKNNGILKNDSWLKNNGQSKLVRTMRSNRKPFSHIIQEIIYPIGTLKGFRGGTVAQRKALEIKHRLRSK
jgi:hypothetical protein